MLIHNLGGNEQRVINTSTPGLKGKEQVNDTFRYCFILKYIICFNLG